MKHKYPDNKQRHIVEMCITQLKLNDIDGETMEYMIHQLGMKQQILRQLILKCDDMELIELMDEKNELNNTINNLCYNEI